MRKRRARGRFGGGDLVRGGDKYGLGNGTEPRRLRMVLSGVMQLESWKRTERVRDCLGEFGDTILSMSE